MYLRTFKTVALSPNIKAPCYRHHIDEFMEWRNAPSHTKWYKQSLLYTGFPKKSQRFQKFLARMIHSSGAYYKFVTDHPQMEHPQLVSPACRFIQYREKDLHVFYTKKAQTISASRLKEGSRIWGFYDKANIPVTILSVEKRYRLQGFLLHYFAYIGKDYMGAKCMPPYLANGVYVAPSIMLSHNPKMFENKITEVVYDPQNKRKH